MRCALHLVACVVLLAGCGGAQRRPPDPLTPLGQERSVEVIEEALATRDAGETRHRVAATLTNGVPVSIDVYVPSLAAGILYMNEQDRRDYRQIPERAEGSQLHVVLGRVSTVGGLVHLLVLQDLDYAYLANPRANERRPEEATVTDVEIRLQRDTLDFVQAVRDLRGPPAGD